MSLRETLELLEKVSEIATLAGIRGKIEEELLSFVASFAMPDNRSQVVFVRAGLATVKDSHVVTFMSPCLALKSGIFGGLSKSQAIDLLRRNERLILARYGIATLGDQDHVVASVDAILETLDPEEFEAAIWHVAIAAETYERENSTEDAF